MTKKRLARVENITIPEAKERVDELLEIVRSKDYESAGGEERRLWQDVLESIRRGHPQAKGLANVALTTTNVEFPRGWGA